MNLSEQLISYLLISIAMVCLGVYGLLLRRNLIALLISLELILNAASLNFLAFNHFVLSNKSIGQIAAIFIIGLAAAEVCVGLSLIILWNRHQSAIDVEQANTLRG